MGVWIDILKLVAQGEPKRAREMIGTKLLSVLLGGNKGATDNTYSEIGSQPCPLIKAIDKFIATLYSSEKAQAEASKYEIRDEIIDQVIADVEETIRLVELCWNSPQLELEIIATSSFWKPNLDRSVAWKTLRVTDLLKSMVVVGVPLPSTIVAKLTSTGNTKFKFDEIANAVSQTRIKQAWRDFRKRQELSKFFCIVDSETDKGVAAEGVDYGSVTISKITCRLLASDAESANNLEVLSEILGPELTKLMEEMHMAEPGGGYRPIAWHKVFWSIFREYEDFQLDLERRDPECRTDEELTEHIIENYQGVIGRSRPFIYRRQKRLYAACKEKIQETILEKVSN